jgi:hypothetical protein
MIRLTLTQRSHPNMVMHVQAWEAERWVAFAQRYRWGVEMEAEAGADEDSTKCYDVKEAILQLCSEV